MQFEYVQSTARLAELVAQWQQAEVLALDTEFVRERTLMPKLGLVQVYDGKQLALLDPQAADLSAFWPLLTAPNIVKVLHSCSEDLEVFRSVCGQMPSPLFDTQVASLFLGKGNSLGFAAMVEQYLAVSLDKGQARTDWLARPLSDEQLHYAAADVFYLLPCYHTIRTELDSKGWTEFVFEEAENLMQRRVQVVADDKLYLQVKNAWTLKPRELAILNELAIYRQHVAVSKDLALGLILKDHQMVEIASRKPGSLESLKNISDLHPGSIRRYGNDIIACIERGKALPLEACPSKIQRLIEHPQYKSMLKQLKAVVTDRAQQLGLALEVVTSKKHLHQVLSFYWQVDDDGVPLRSTPELLSGWRGQVFTAVIQPLFDARVL